MKLHLPSFLRVALLACMACSATAYAGTYLAEGVSYDDLASSTRFYDGGKGRDWSYFSTNATNIYNANGKDLSIFGDLAGSIQGTSSYNLSFSNLTSDNNQCWAYTASNMLQYWQTYYGVFSKKAREDKAAPVHGLNYDSQYMTQLGGTQSLKLNKLFYDNFENVGSGNGPVMALGWYLIKDNGWSALKDEAADSSPGYFAQYFSDYRSTNVYTTAASLREGTMSQLSNSLKGHFGYTQNADGVWEQTTKGQIVHLELTGAGSHAITSYGFETDENGDITALYVVNSDDTTYNLEKVYAKYTTNNYGDAQISLYYDKECTQSWRGWIVTGWSSINTPEALRNMLAEYEKGKMTWMGNLDSWTATAAVAADVNVLPTDETGWMVYAGSDTQHAGYYNSYYVADRGVVFNDEATSGTVNVAEDISVPSMEVNNTNLTYSFNGGETARTITVDEFIKKGAGSVVFDGVNLVAGTATLEGDVTFDELHVTGTLNADGKKILANSVTLDGDATIGTLGEGGSDHGTGTIALTINGGATTIQNNWSWTNLKSLELSDTAKLNVGASLSVADNIGSTSDTLPTGGTAEIKTTYALLVGTAGDASTGNVDLAGSITTGAYVNILGNANVTGDISSEKESITIGGVASIGGKLSAGNGSITLSKGGSVGSLGVDSTLKIAGGTTSVQSTDWTNLKSLEIGDDSQLNVAASIGVAGNITSTNAEGTGAGMNATYCITVGTEGKADTGHVTLTGDMEAGSYILIQGDATIGGTLDSHANYWGDGDSYIKINGNANIGKDLKARQYVTIGGNATVGGKVDIVKDFTVGGDLTLNQGGYVGGAVSANNITVKGDASFNVIGTGTGDPMTDSKTNLTVSHGTTTLRVGDQWTNLKSLSLSEQARLDAAASVSVAENITTGTATGTLTEGSQAGINTRYCLVVGTEGKADTGNVTLKGDVTAGAFITIRGNADISGKLATSGTDDNHHIAVGGDATIGGELSGNKNVTIGGKASVGGTATVGGNLAVTGDLTLSKGGSVGGTVSADNLTLGADTTLKAGSVSVNGAITGDAAGKATVESSGTIELGGNASYVALEAQSITVAAGATLDNVDMSLAGSELSLTDVVIKGNSSFSTTATGPLTLMANNVTLVLDSSNSVLAQDMQTFSLLTGAPLTQAETQSNIFSLNSTVLQGVDVSGDLTLDISSWADEILASGADSLTINFADDVDFSQAENISMTLDGKNYSNLALDAGSTGLLTVPVSRVVPEPSTATLSLLALAALAARRRRK